MEDSLSCFKLSEDDKGVLERVFNPEFSGEVYNYESAVELASEKLDFDSSSGPRARLMQAIILSENHQFSDALLEFNSIVDEHPDFVEVYNDRAQLLQWMGDKDAALKDLELVVQKTHGRGKIAALAFTQMGIIHKSMGREETAMENFKIGSTLGNHFSHHMVALNNPYSALCNDLLKKTIQDLSEVK